MMKLLLKKGASINAQNKKGLSTIHIAVNKRKGVYVKILLEHHCDINIQVSHQMSFMWGTKIIVVVPICQ